jgi:hypothetical protein
MKTYARPEPEAKWERGDDGEYRSARILCGKLDKNGDPRCPGPLGYYRAGTEIRSPDIWFPGMQLGADGVLRPYRKALQTYRRTGVLTPIDTERRSRHLDRHRGQMTEFMRRIDPAIDLFPPPERSPVVVCPRCDTVQDVLDEEDLDNLRNAMPK